MDRTDRMNERLGQLPPDKQALVRRLSEKQLRGEPAPHQPIPAITTIPREGDLPLSFAQQRLWFLERLAPGTPVYSLPASVHLTGALDVAALEKSLNEVVRRHEVFRTAFRAREGKPTLVIAPHLGLKLPLADLQALPEAEQETETCRLALAEARRPFDLAQAPLLRATLLRLGEQRHVLLLNVHQIVCDGSSLVLLFEELRVLYEAYAAGRSPALPELAVQYADFSQWQRQHMQGVRLESQLAYWKQRLAGAPTAVDLPTDGPRTAAQPFQGDAHTLEIPKTIADALRALSERSGVTLFTTLFAAFKTLLYRTTGKADLVVGTLVAHRPLPEVQKLIGLFLNPLIIRTDLSDDPTFLTLLQRLQGTIWEAMEHQDLPFERLVAELAPQRDRNRQPLFNVAFTQEVKPQVDFLDMDLRFWDDDSGTAKHDLSLSIVDSRGELFVNLAYNTSLFDAEVVHRIATQFQTLLEGVIAKPTLPLSALPLLAHESGDAPALAAPALQDEGAERPVVTGRSSTGVAEAVAAVWADVLEVDHVDLQSNFFELGGHSLLALQAIPPLLERFRAGLQGDTFELEGRLLNKLFEEPTAAALALVLEEALLEELEGLTEEEAQRLLEEM